MRPRRRPSPLHALLVVVVLGACAHAPPPPPGSAAEVNGAAPAIPEAARSALAGTWVYAGGAAEQAQVDEAVARATADMGFLARGFAAQALGDRARPRDRYTLSFEGPLVTIASPESPIERGPLGGPAVTLTDRFGDQSQTTFRLDDGALVEAGTNPDGSGETVFTPSADGRTLRIRRLMQSSRLSAPVDVTLTYRRQD